MIFSLYPLRSKEIHYAANDEKTLSMLIKVLKKATAIWHIRIG